MTSRDSHQTFVLAEQLLTGGCAPAGPQRHADGWYLAGEEIFVFALSISAARIFVWHNSLSLSLSIEALFPPVHLSCRRTLTATARFAHRCRPDVGSRISSKDYVNRSFETHFTSCRYLERCAKRECAADKIAVSLRCARLDLRRENARSYFTE